MIFPYMEKFIAGGEDVGIYDLLVEEAEDFVDCFMSISQLQCLLNGSAPRNQGFEMVRWWMQFKHDSFHCENSVFHAVGLDRDMRSLNHANLSILNRPYKYFLHGSSLERRGGEEERSVRRRSSLSLFGTKISAEEREEEEKRENQRKRIRVICPSASSKTIFRPSCSSSSTNA